MIKYPVETLILTLRNSLGLEMPPRCPRTRWMDDVNKDLQQIGLPLAEALDRPKRRRLVNLFGSKHDNAPIA